MAKWAVRNSLVLPLPAMTLPLHNAESHPRIACGLGSNHRVSSFMQMHLRR